MRMTKILIENNLWILPLLVLGGINTNPKVKILMIIIMTIANKDVNVKQEVVAIDVKYMRDLYQQLKLYVIILLVYIWMDNN